MNILILGANSALGRAFTGEFATGNRLFLLGRRLDRLHEAGQEAKESGAEEVRLIQHDLADGCAAILNALENERVDLLINLAGATSNVRDSAIELQEIEAYTRADLLTPVELATALLQKNSAAYHRERPFCMIFISSILALVDSPDRAIYASYKRLQEAYFKRLAAQQDERVRLTVVTVGTVLNRNEVTRRHRAIAAKTARLYPDRETIFWGIQGRILLFISRIAPWLLSGLIALSRRLRGEGNTQS